MSVVLGQRTTRCYTSVILIAENPLDQRWVENFIENYGRRPTDIDRQDRLFSLLFAGSGNGGRWTQREWEFYRANRQTLWSREMQWPVDEKPLGYERFEAHLRQLAGHYGSGPEATMNFARAAGLIWGGIDYEGSALTALFRASVGDHLLQLHEGASGWRADYVDDDNPAHHWVAAFLAGYTYGAIIGRLSNSIRDMAQLVTGQGGTWADIHLGNAAAAQGAYLRRMASKRATGENVTVYDGVLRRMRVELREGD